VHDADEPDAPVSLLITANDKLLARVLANRPRADLRTAGIGTGRHAFHVCLPTVLTEPQRRSARITRCLDGARLPTPSKWLETKPPYNTGDRLVYQRGRGPDCRPH
jgi:hypothetical protein